MSKEDLLQILEFINEFEESPSVTWEQFKEA